MVKINRNHPRYTYAESVGPYMPSLATDPSWKTPFKREIQHLRILEHLVGSLSRPTILTTICHLRLQSSITLIATQRVTVPGHDFLNGVLEMIVIRAIDAKAVL